MSVSAAAARRVLLLRTDSVGTLLWQQTYRWQTINAGWSVAELPDGGFVLGGVTSDLGFGNQGTYIVRTDSAGRQLWHQRFGTPGLINGIGIVRLTQDGNIAVLGAMGYPPNGTRNLFRHCVRKLNLQGTLLWQREIGPVSDNCDAFVLLELPDGSLVAGGQDAGPSTAPRNTHAALFKLCPDGDSVWYRTHLMMPHSDNYLRGLAATPDGGFVAAGFLHVTPPDTGTPDAWVFKVDSAGYLQAGGAPVGVACRPLGVGSAAAAAAAVATLYPNPTAGEVRVSYRLPPPARAAEVVVLDALGKRCAQRSLVGTSGEATLSLAELPAGVYRYQIVVGGTPVQAGELVRLP